MLRQDRFRDVTDKNRERSEKAAGPAVGRIRMSAPAGLFAALHLLICKGGAQNPPPQVLMAGPGDKEALPSRQEQHVAQPGPAALRRPDPTLRGELECTQGCLLRGYLNPRGKSKRHEPTYLSPKDRLAVP